MSFQSIPGQPVQSLSALLEVTGDIWANAANTAAFIFSQFDRLNWAGFYFYRNESLLLGPFCGMPACVQIAPSRGVCGTAFTTKMTQRVADVHAFPGHIACDSSTNSELVIPLFKADGSCFGVLDLDSPDLNRFNAADEALLTELAEVFSASIDWAFEASVDSMV